MKEKKSSIFPAKCPFGPKEWTYLQKKYHLSPRELQVTICICTGCNNQQIAERCKIKLNTAKLYVRNVYRKVGVNNKIILLLNFLRDVSGLVSTSYK